MVYKNSQIKYLEKKLIFVQIFFRKSALCIRYPLKNEDILNFLLLETSSIQPIIEYFNQKSSFERKTKSRQSWQFLVQAALSPEQPAPKTARSA